MKNKIRLISMGTIACVLTSSIASPLFVAAEETQDASSDVVEVSEEESLETDSEDENSLLTNAINALLESEEDDDDEEDDEDDDDDDLDANTVDVTQEEVTEYITVSIDSMDDYKEFAENCHYDSWSQDKSVVLNVDLDFEGEDFTPIESFGGLFDGQGHTMSGISITDYAAETGVFGTIQNTGMVANLNVEGEFSPDGVQDTIGGIAGINHGTISNCTFEGTISADQKAGGIVGRNGLYGIVIACTSSGDITASSATGGIVGYNEGTIAYCDNTARINTEYEDSTISIDEVNDAVDNILQSGEIFNSGNLTSDSDTGGIAGFSSGVIISCTNSGKIGYEHVGYNVGGIVGRSSGFLSHNTNYADVYGRKDVGGIAGQMQPYLSMNFSEETLDEMSSELDTLFDIVDRAMDDMSSYSDETFNHLTNISELAQIAKQAVKDLADEGTDSMDDLTDDLNSAMDTLDSVIDIFSSVGDSLEDYMDDLDDSLDDVDDGLSDYLNGLADSTDDLVDDLEDALPDLDSYDLSGEDAEAVQALIQQMLASELSSSSSGSSSSSTSSSEEDTTTDADTDTSTEVESEDGSVLDSDNTIESDSSTTTDSDSTTGSDTTTENDGTTESDTTTGSDSTTEVDTSTESDGTTESDSTVESDSSSGSSDSSGSESSSDSSSSSGSDSSSDSSSSSESGSSSESSSSSDSDGNSTSHAPASPYTEGVGSFDSETEEDASVVVDSAETIQSEIDELSDLSSDLRSAAEEAESVQSDTSDSSESSVESEEATSSSESASDTSAASSAAAAAAQQALMSSVNSTLSGVSDSVSTIQGSLEDMSDILEDYAESSTDVSDITDSVSDAMDAVSDTDDMMDDIDDAMDLMGTVDLHMDGVSDTMRSNGDVLYDSMSQLMDEMDALTDTMENATDDTSDTFDEMTAQMEEVTDTMIDSIEDLLNGDFDDDDEDTFQDISDEDVQNTYRGRAANCVNEGDIEADMNVGGIVGMMGMEFGLDPEADIEKVGNETLDFIFQAKCIVDDCENVGEITVRSNYSGGIVGHMNLGLVTGCENYGELDSSGSYVGGVAGYSAGTVRNSAAKCDLQGEEYVGGIAGYGETIRGNLAMINVEDADEYVGAIAGRVEDIDSSDISENYYYSTNAYGIDGVSYEGIAEGISYSELIKKDRIPDDFDSIILRFKAEDIVIDTLLCDYGDSLTDDEVPTMPDKEGYYGEWDREDFSNITSDDTVRAKYFHIKTLLSSEQRRESGLAALEVDGLFREEDTVTVTEQETEGEEYERLLVEIPDDGQQTHQIRYLVPDEAREGTTVIYLVENGEKTRLETQEVGIYLTFDVDGNEVVIASEGVLGETNTTEWILLIILIIVIVIVILLIRRHVRRKKRRKKEEENKEQWTDDDVS